MKKTTKVLGGLVAAGLIAGAAPAFAIPALTFNSATYGTQTVDPFTGFDWAASASAVTTNYVPDGTTIATTTYLASAANVFTTNSEAAFISGLTSTGTPGTAFEFTIKATIFETAVVDAIDPNKVTFTATGGSFDIYYDSTANANRSTGSGFLDGTRIISGTITPGAAGQFTGDGTGLNGTGNFEFFGVVTFTETDSSLDAFIDPALVATNAVATLQLGTNVTGGWTRPGSWNNGLWDGITGNADDPRAIPTGALVFQADGNQGFSTVPEPGTLALLGLGLLGMASRIRRSL